MALLYLDGFDLYGYVSPPSRVLPTDSRWTYNNTNWVRVFLAGRRSGYALGNGDQAISYTTDWSVFNLKAQYDTLTIGFAYFPSTGTPVSASYPIFILADGVNYTDGQFYIHTTSGLAMEVRATRAGTLLGTTGPGALVQNAWQYIEMQMYCHDTNGSVEIRIDGTVVLSITGVNTQNQGSGGIQTFQYRNFTGSQGTYTYIDDMYVLDDSGTEYIDFLGDIAVDGHVFTADGSDGDWTNSSSPADHYTDIDDLGSGYNTNYIEGSVVGEQDSFDITPTAYQTGIIGVQVVGYGWNNTGGTAKIKPYVKIGGVDYYGDEVQMAAGTTDKHAYNWPRNPATDSLWTNAVITAAEFGFEVTEIT